MQGRGRRWSGDWVLHWPVVSLWDLVTGKGWDGFDSWPQTCILGAYGRIPEGERMGANLE